jgi:predicted metal-dependent peptidase
MENDMLMINKQLTAEQRLERAIVEIMHNDKYIALAGVLMIGKREVVDDLPTAATNGRDEFYGRKFVESLNDAELRFLVLHECYHKLYRHLVTWRHLHEENPQLANMACDYVINIKLMDDNAGDRFATMPMRNGKQVGLCDPKYRGMDSAQVYKLLDEESEGDNGQGQGDSDGGLDSHDWEGAKELSEEEGKQLERDIDEAIRQGALAAGKMGSGGNRDLEALMTPKVDWREALREFINTTCAGNDYSTWRRPNRRFVSSGYYMPSGVSERVGELIIAIDTSGSIGGAELSKFLSEVKGICDTVKPDAIRLLYWDTEVCADEKYEGAEIDNLTSSTKPEGGGGTVVECVPAYITEHSIKAQAVVVLTDGYLGGSWGQWSMPVLWAIVGRNKEVADVGKTIHVKD